MRLTKAQLAAYCLGHFWMDLCCAWLLAGWVGTPVWALCALVYNFCAFALQMPIGLWADAADRNACVAAGGCALAALGWGLGAGPWPLAAAVAAGVGNACFHVGGGIDVLNAGAQKSAALGVFVSPGALGLYVGTVLAGQGLPGLVPAVAGLLGFGALLLWLAARRGSLSSANAPVHIAPGPDAAAALVCCFAVVVLRSGMGMAFRFPWKTGPWAVAALCAVALGKAAGGFLGDALGMRRAAVVSLGAAALLFCFGNLPAAGVGAVFLFNMTMPVTLWAAAKLLPGGKGFAFGLLTFGLFVGFLPGYLGWALPTAAAPLPLYTAGALVSLLLLVWGLYKGGVE